MKTLRELITSKKVITLIVGLTVTIAAKYGFDVDRETVIGILTLFSILIGAQGAADLGREAAKVQADAAVKVAESNSQAAIIAASSGQRTVVVTPPLDPPGFARVDLLVILFTTALIMALLVISGCSWMKGETKKVGAAVVDCTSENATTLTSQFGPTVDMLLRSAADSGTGQVDWAPLKAAARGFATDAARCVLATVIASHLNPASEAGVQSSPLQLNPTDLRSGFAELSRELYGGQSFKTKDGTL